MVDRISPAQRSKNMSRIRSRDTKPELMLRSALFGLGLRYRLCRRDLPGTPDIVFVRDRLAIQVRGCFWHQHKGCRHGRVPKSRTDYWAPKLERTKKRDADNDRALQELGWRLIVVWECELAQPDQVDAVAHDIFLRLTSGRGDSS